MSSPGQQWLIAAALAAIIATAAHKARALAPSGAIAAAIMGTIVIGTGGWWAGVILVAFFASSSLVSRFQREAVLDQARGSRRDWVQVFANGWGMLAGAVLFGLTAWQPWLLFGIGAIAAATADTWSSEIGRTATSLPRLITNWKPVPRGTSGAVSIRGLVASFIGAAFIALLTLIAIRGSDLFNQHQAWTVVTGIIVAGFLGGLVDSWLGATVQEHRYCDACNGRTEANPHSCGTSTRHIGGLHGFNNDVVNFLCVLTGALIGLFSGIL